MKLVIVIAAAALVVAAGVIIFLVWGTGPRPSGKFKVDRIAINEDPWQLADKPAADGDGAADIAAAIKSFDARQAEIDKDLSRSSLDNLYERVARLYANPGKLSVATTLPWRSAEFVLASSAKTKFNLEQQVRMPPLEWRWPKTFCQKLEAIALAAIIEGRMAEKRNRPDEAERIYKAVLIYGVRLAENRARVYYQLEGLSAQAEAADALARLYREKKDADKSKAAESYMTAAQETLARAREGTFFPVFQHVNKWNVGDLLMFAENHPDPAWRVEALLALGMCQHNPVAKGGEDAISRCLKKYANDSDPNIAAAARWSRDLTRPDYRMQTGAESGSN